jgi:hypothetical protein
MVRQLPSGCGIHAGAGLAGRAATMAVMPKMHRRDFLRNLMPLKYFNIRKMNPAKHVKALSNSQ